jgi:hypothetical protein
MPEEQKSVTQQKPQSTTHFVFETKGSPPPEPITVAPFQNDPNYWRNELAPPPGEPTKLAPFHGNQFKK